MNALIMSLYSSYEMYMYYSALKSTYEFVCLSKGVFDSSVSTYHYLFPSKDIYTDQNVIVITEEEVVTDTTDKWNIVEIN